MIYETQRAKAEDEWSPLPSTSLSLSLSLSLYGQVAGSDGNRAGAVQARHMALPARGQRAEGRAGGREIRREMVLDQDKARSKIVVDEAKQGNY